MRLSSVLRALNINENLSSPDSDLIITGIAMDSRQVQQGNIFVAITGFQSDGHDYVDEALNKGAVAIIGEKQLCTSVPYFQVSESRKALGLMASLFYQHPSRKHKIIGITGTNGKTTVSYMLKHILEKAGKSCSLLGTVSYIVNNQVIEPSNTTPNALQMQSLLSQSNDEYVIMEISSHAIKQHRIEGLELDYGVFTNLSHEHLDYHNSMEEYFDTKKEMFNYLKATGIAIINNLNPWGEVLSKILKEKNIPTLCLGNSTKDDLQLKDISLKGKTAFILNQNTKSYEVFLQTPGLHNAYNAALAFLIALDLGIPSNLIIKALKAFRGVPGRFEMISHPSGAVFIIDYAHTQDAVEFCLQATAEQDAKRIIHIFGFRGKRDISKRKHMISASAAKADLFILTFDDLNGVSEEEMLTELNRLNKNYGMGKGLVIPDRTSAIETAWNNVREGDWVVITGKGPEQYQMNFSLPTSSDKETVQYLQNNNLKVNFDKDFMWTSSI